MGLNVVVINAARGCISLVSKENAILRRDCATCTASSFELRLWSYGCVVTPLWLAACNSGGNKNAASRFAPIIVSTPLDPAATAPTPRIITFEAEEKAEKGTERVIGPALDAIIRAAVISTSIPTLQTSVEVFAMDARTTRVDDAVRITPLPAPVPKTFVSKGTCITFLKTAASEKAGKEDIRDLRDKRDIR